jgi:hypothetical protein
MFTVAPREQGRPALGPWSLLTALSWWLPWQKLGTGSTSSYLIQRLQSPTPALGNGANALCASLAFLVLARVEYYWPLLGAEFVIVLGIVSLIDNSHLSAVYG